jgi:hypothetical protein
MNTTPSPTLADQRPSPRRRVPLLLQRVARIIVAGIIIGSILHFVARRVHDSSRPAGFSRGLLHGALMPLALPNLAVGDDVTIYASSNDGRPYKLGYTAGVNGCGLLFFGLFFWRIGRWTPRPGQ